MPDFDFDTSKKQKVENTSYVKNGKGSEVYKSMFHTDSDLKNAE